MSAFKRNAADQPFINDSVFRPDGYHTIEEYATIHHFSLDAPAYDQYYEEGEGEEEEEQEFHDAVANPFQEDAVAAPPSPNIAQVSPQSARGRSQQNALKADTDGSYQYLIENREADAAARQTFHDDDDDDDDAQGKNSDADAYDDDDDDENAVFYNAREDLDTNSIQPSAEQQRNARYVNLEALEREKRWERLAAAAAAVAAEDEEPAQPLQAEGEENGDEEEAAAEGKLKPSRHKRLSTIPEEDDYEEEEQLGVEGGSESGSEFNPSSDEEEAGGGDEKGENEEEEGSEEEEEGEEEPAALPASSSSAVRLGPLAILKRDGPPRVPIVRLRDAQANPIINALWAAVGSAGPASPAPAAISPVIDRERRAWTDAEKRLTGRAMTAALAADCGEWTMDDRYAVTSTRLEAMYGIRRSWAAVRTAYVRQIRQNTGLDERKTKKPHRLQTSIQKVGKRSRAEWKEAADAAEAGRVADEAVKAQKKRKREEEKADKKGKRRRAADDEDEASEDEAPRRRKRARSDSRASESLLPGDADMREAAVEEVPAAAGAAGEGSASAESGQAAQVAADEELARRLHAEEVANSRPRRSRRG